jgi:hypothetical protein
MITATGVGTPYPTQPRVRARRSRASWTRFTASRGDEPREALDDAGDGVRTAEQAERSDRDEKKRRNRQNRVVGECGREVVRWSSSASFAARMNTAR